MIPDFARRTRWNLATNRLTAAVAARRSAGLAVLDLTESNPTRCGLIAAETGREILAAISNPAALAYDPDPRGVPSAREAIAALYSRGGRAGQGGLPPRNIFITASTSEAYGWLFRLLCDPGDIVLVPAPSYPLFDFLASIHDVTLRPYPLIEDDGFRIDIDRLRETAVSPADETARLRAILIVNPGNPTGAFLGRDEHASLAEICAQRGLALISDEVFGDYAFDDAAVPHRTISVAGDDRCLTFALNGLSKMLAMPQMKLGWIAASGPEAALEEATARLEVIADTYLSANTPVQTALPSLLAMRETIQAPIRARLTGNRIALEAAFGAAHPARVLPSSGGWSAILRVPATSTDEEWAVALLEKDGVLVQPGFFYDFPDDGRLVVSLLPDPRDFSDGVRRLAARIASEG